MSNGTHRDRWTAEVLRATSISDAVRVALLALALEMDDEGMVEVSQKDLAEKLARTRNRVGERISAAIGAGLLDRVSRGQRNGPTRYRATLPAPSSHPSGGAKKPEVFAPPGQGEEDSLRTDLQGEENPGLRTPRGGQREPFDPSVFAPPGQGEETAPLYKDRARARSGSTYSNHHPAPAVDDRPLEGVVIPLFDEKNKEPGKTLSERSERLETSAPGAHENHDPFAEFWKTYPRKVGKKAAQKAWDKAIKDGADPAAILWAARAYASLPRDPADGLRYVAHPTTWLNQGRWEDEPDHAAPAPRTTEPWQQAGDDALARAMQRALAKEGRL